MVLAERLELPAFGLQIRCTTVVLRQPNAHRTGLLISAYACILGSTVAAVQYKDRIYTQRV